MLADNPLHFGYIPLFTLNDPDSDICALSVPINDFIGIYIQYNVINFIDKFKTDHMTYLSSINSDLECHWLVSVGSSLSLVLINKYNVYIYRFSSVFTTSHYNYILANPQIHEIRP